MKLPLFRQTALEKLSSPEQLDEVLDLSSGRAWLGLSSLITLLAVSALYSYAVFVPTDIQGKAVISGPSTAILFVPYSSLSAVSTGDDVQLLPNWTLSSQEVLRGKVSAILSWES